MAFIETPRFPDRLAYGSSGGPRYATTVAVTGGGYETRNIDWSQARARFDVAHGVRAQEDLEDLIEFFHAVAGRAHGFRFRDPGDYKSCRTQETPAFTDQDMDPGDEDNGVFQIVKRYIRGGVMRTREIRKPVAGTVSVGVDGTEVTDGWSVDTTTGIVTFSTPPGSGATVTAGFVFDTPCRFDADELSTVFEDYRQASAEVPIVEIRV